MVDAWAMYPLVYYEFNASVNNPALGYPSFQKPLPYNQANQNSLSEAFCAVEQGPCSFAGDLFATKALSYVQAHASPDSVPFFLFWCPTVPHLGTYQTGGVLSSPVRRLGDRNGTLSTRRIHVPRANDRRASRVQARARRGN